MIIFLKDNIGRDIPVNYNVTYKRVKNVNMRLGKDNVIEVSMSKRVTQAELVDILVSKSDWILKVLEKNKNKNDYKVAKELTEEDSYYFFFGKKYKLVSIPYEEFKNINSDFQMITSENVRIENVKMDVERNIIYLNSDNKKWKQELNRYEEKVFIEKIRYYLNKEIKELSRYNLPVKNIRIKTLKSCWGSCQVVKKEITLNRKLVNYNEHCLRYVIIHELAHLVYADHSKKFYSIIESVMPEYKKIRKELNES